MVIHYYYSSPTTSFEDTVLATPGRRRPSLTVPFMTLTLTVFLRSNGVIHRTQKVIQVDDNGHVHLLSFRFISVPVPPKPISLCYRFGWQTEDGH